MLKRTWFFRGLLLLGWLIILMKGYAIVDVLWKVRGKERIIFC